MNLPRRGGRLLLAAFAAALLVPAAAQADYTPIHGTDFFSPTSVWNAPLAADAPQSKSSSTYVNTLVGTVQQYGTWINTDQYSVPVDVVPATQPLVKVILDNS